MYNCEKNIRTKIQNEFCGCNLCLMKLGLAKIIRLLYFKKRAGQATTTNANVCTYVVCLCVKVDVDVSKHATGSLCFR